MLLCLMLVPCATAQTTEQENAVGHFTYSPYLTVLYSPYSLKGDKSNGHRVQAGFGFEAEYRVRKDVGVSAGIELENFGVKESGSVSFSLPGGGTYPIFDYEKEYDVKTLNLPVMLNIHPLKSDRLALRVGIQPGLVLNTHPDGLKSRKSSLVIPLGVAVSLGDRVQAELRYHLGFTNYLETKDTPVRQRTLALNVAYVIR